MHAREHGLRKRSEVYFRSAGLAAPSVRFADWRASKEEKINKNKVFSSAAQLRPLLAFVFQLSEN